MKDFETFIGLDVHKETIAVAIADQGRKGEVRFYGAIDNTSVSVTRLVTRLADKIKRALFVYEAGPCGYTLYRQLARLHCHCQVIAPSMIPKRSGDRIKNDTRDAISLARLSRAGELTEINVPDEVHEAIRDLVRARHVACKQRRRAKQRIQSFLLLHDKHYDSKPWTKRHRIWLADRSFSLPAQQIAFQNYLNSLEQEESRCLELEEQLREVGSSWSMFPVVTALQALRGVAFIVAISIVAEVGDLRRFSTPKQLMAYLGLIPGEYSSGSSIRQRGITKTGNTVLRSLLFEAAWNYRNSAKVGQYMLVHRPEVSQEVKDIAWKAQVRLCKRYRKLIGSGKKTQVAVTAVARELLGFIWAIGIKVLESPTRT